MVKVFFTSVGNVETDGFIRDKVRRFPGIAFVELPDCDVVFVSWTWRPNFVADIALIERILHSGRPVVVFDYLECHFCYEMLMTYMEKWVASLLPYAPLAALEPAIKLYFKREYQPAKLPALSFPIVPTDFIGDYYPGYDDLQPQAEFNARPIDVFMSYGYSSCDRAMLHAELLRKHHHPAHMAMTVPDLEYTLERGTQHIYAILYTPHYRRHPITEILRYQSMAKLSVCLRGAADKCFRHAESAYNSVMAMQQTDSQFAFPWNAENCLTLPNLAQPQLNPPCRLDVVKAATALNTSLATDLYPVYAAGFQNSKHYIAENYIRDYWVPLLQQHGVWP